MTNIPVFLDEKDVAVRLGVSIATLRHWRRTGQGPAFYKFHRGKAGAIRYRLDDVTAWLETKRVGG